MRTIHDEDSGSPINRLRAELEQTRAAMTDLSRRKDELETVLAAGGIGYCRIDPDLRVRFASTSFKAQFGCAPDDDVQWSTLIERIRPEHRSRLESAVRTALEKCTDMDVLIRTGGAEGPEEQWRALQGRPIRDTGAGSRELVLISRDAGAQGRERRLRRIAESANRAKDEFLSVVSHELRSPLNAILGWNRILAVKHSEDEDITSIAARIERSAKSQLKMVNDLLDFGRIGTGKLRIEPRQLRLANVASAALEATRPAATAKDVELRADFSEEQHPVFGDPDRLQQVVSNLLSNAVKFTPSGGRITLTVHMYDGFAEVAVSDTGQGIAAELLPHVFDRFRQGDSSSTRQTGGLGLGLTLVREIVALHGGKVEARSEGPGRGATFTVRLPTRPGGSHVPRRSPGEASECSRSTTLSGLSILVVDDEPDARTVVAETLRLEGADVAVSDSAVSAFKQLQAEGANFHVVVTDIGMPEEDGYSLIRKLRALRSGGRVLAIALTGYASSNDVEAAMDAGFDLHVPKPVDFDTFVPLIRRLATPTDR